MFSINKIRGFYRTKPSYYKMICSVLSKGFYLIYFGIILFLIGLITLNYLFTIKNDSSLFSYFLFGVITLLILLIIKKVMFIKCLKIKGLYMDRETYKKLWDIVESLTGSFKGIKIHKIVLVDKCKLDIVTQFKFGLWGRKRTTLIIGLPLLLGFSEREVEIAIASVISRNSKKIKRIDRGIRKTYFKLDNLFNDKKCLVKTSKIFDFIVSPILKKFYHYYKNVAFISVRESILNGDKLLLDIYNEKDIAEVLLKKCVHKHLVEKIYLQKVNKGMEETGQAPENLFTLMNEYLNENISGRDIIEALKVLKLSDRKEIAFIGTPIDRVEKIGYDIEDFQYEFGDNAVRFLGKNFEKIIKKFNIVSLKENKEIWKKYSKTILKEKEVYDRLCKAFAMFELQEEEFQRYMELREKFSGVNTAIIEGKKLCITFPLNAQIRYTVGKMLLSGNNAQGIDYIENAIRLNPIVSVEGYKDIINYYIRREEYVASLDYEKKYSTLKSQCKEALKERENPKLRSGYYCKVDLDNDTLKNIKNVLLNKKIVKGAYISKLKVKMFNDIPHYILWVNYKLNFFTMEETLRKKDKEIKGDISLENITVVHLNGDNCYLKILLKRIRKIKILSKIK